MPSSSGLKLSCKHLIFKDLCIRQYIYQAPSVEKLLKRFALINFSGSEKSPLTQWAIAVGMVTFALACQSAGKHDEENSATMHKDDSVKLASYRWNLRQAFDATGTQKNNWQIPGMPAVQLWFSEDGVYGTQIDLPPHSRTS